MSHTHLLLASVYLITAWFLSFQRRKRIGKIVNYDSTVDLF